MIIWKSQSIQTLKTRTLVHNTSLLSLRHQIKLFSCPKSKRVYRDFLSVDSYNYEPAKTEWSQSWWDVFFLAYISLMPPSMPLPQELRKAWPDTTCHTRNRCDITIHHASGKSNFQQNLRQQGSCTTNRAFCQNIYCLLESTQVLEHTHDCNGIIPPPPVWYYYKRYNTHIDKRWNFKQNFIHQRSLITNASKLFAWKFSSPDTFFQPPPPKTSAI